MQATYTAQAIADHLLLKLQPGDYADRNIRQYAFDSRRISRAADTCFLALAGSARDGHQFVQAVYDKGVRVFWVSQPVRLPNDATVINCTNVLETVQRLAAHHRAGFSGSVVGITGSNGKTIVKEWLYDLLGARASVYRSPGSFNSQLGVPLAVLGLRPHHHIALIEAGISFAGEMQRLYDIILPDIGILTHMGRAHEQGFPSFEDKLQEKCRLFQSARTVLTGTHDYPLPLPDDVVQQSVGSGAIADYAFEMRTSGSKDVAFALQDTVFELPIRGDAALENAMLSIAAAVTLGEPAAQLPPRVAHLRPVAMRQEMITDNPQITILNDAYTADIDSLHQALQRLDQDGSQPQKAVILTELEEQHVSETELLEIIRLTASHAHQLVLIGESFVSLAETNTLDSLTADDRLDSLSVHATTAEFIDDLQPNAFSGTTVLLKGARRFQLEQIIPVLSRQAVASYLEVDLGRMRHNLSVIQQRIPAETTIMAMLKASSYGSGGWQVAQAIAQMGVEAIGVAYTGEGIALREKNCQLPILVMNADFASVERLVEFDLTPAVWSFPLLRRLSELHLPLDIQLEFDTGMGRLGFSSNDIPELLRLLEGSAQLRVTGVFSHLAAAENPQEDDFTSQQFTQFEQIRSALEPTLGPLQAHLLNTAGILRFPENAYDMVRLGIGLYGISPLVSTDALEEVCSLRSRISQIRSYPAGSSISYGRTAVLNRETRVATIPVGYADGIPRAASNGRASVIVRGQACPILGKICMDMLMIDLTAAPDAVVGDEVLLFGHHGDHHLSIRQLAEAANTIPYEILVNVSERVKRVYINS